MEFRLTYQGKLFATRSSRDANIKRVPHKHELRREFHRQLKRLWETQAVLTEIASVKEAGRRSWLEETGDHYKKHGFRWIPLVSSHRSLFCKMEILMLRPGGPGNVKTDLDNRLKTLFDALKMPFNPDEIKGMTPQDGENPFFVLLEDDRLLTHISVESDSLLQDVDGDPNDVRLVIKATIRPYEVTIGNIAFTA